MSKRALLIGINRYAIPGNDLRGCVNDVRNVASALQDCFGFLPADITTLLDEQATKAAMQEGITSLITSGQPGDTLYLHYSGHGANVVDTNSDEPDGRDEILCPHDLDWNDPLSDDWLRSTFDQLNPAASLTVVMDCCHSGSNTREPLAPDAPVIPRYMPNPDDEQAGGAFTGRRKRASRRTNDVTVVNITEALLAGCRDWQTSADATIDGEFNGALTYYLVEAMRSQPDATYRQIHAATVQSLDGRYDQVPQLEGTAPRLHHKFLAAGG